ncbi:peptide deformylase domain protein [Mycobacterium xenopi 3993]|nr:peptide deformylase domain protein [Mycobacterium xenopi 3993]
MFAAGQAIGDVRVVPRSICPRHGAVHIASLDPSGEFLNLSNVFMKWHASAIFNHARNCWAVTKPRESAPFYTAKPNRDAPPPAASQRASSHRPSPIAMLLLPPLRSAHRRTAQAQSRCSSSRRFAARIVAPPKLQCHGRRTYSHRGRSDLAHPDRSGAGWPDGSLPDDLPDLIATLYDTMDAAYGVGLAANQIGVGLRVFVYDCADERGQTARRRGVVINPVLETSEIPETMPDPETDDEGCLSVPGSRSRPDARNGLGSPDSTPKAIR